MSTEELWQTSLAEIEVSISKANFLTWFRNTSIINKKEGLVVLAVPNAFTKEWLENKYHQIILRALRNAANDVKEIKFIIDAHAAEKLAQQKQRVEESRSSTFDGQLGFSDISVDKETNLNPKYTFESFIVGSSNELAHAAALAVSENLGAVYNPLFLYGGVGLGKTHLLQSIGNAVLKKHSRKRVRYVTSEQFTSEIVSAIRKQGMQDIKDEYRWVDLLIIDDVQFISGKVKTQEEFFYTFNALYEKNKQIVLSSDRPPSAIPTLEERLRSRFEGGMIADISVPDYETRLAILRTKVLEKGLDIDEKTLEFVADSITSNIRELEGALNRIVATMRLGGKQPSLDKVKSLVSSNRQRISSKLTAKVIIKTVSEFYDVKEEQLVNQSRKREIVKPRQVCMYLIREELKNSYPFIGDRFGGRDHTTVMHAVNKITREIERDGSLAEEINLIKGRLLT